MEKNKRDGLFEPCAHDVGQKEPSDLGAMTVQRIHERCMKITDSAV